MATRTAWTSTATLSPVDGWLQLRVVRCLHGLGPSNRAGVTVDFTSGGPQSVAVTATLGSCTVTTTKTVPVP